MMFSWQAVQTLQKQRVLSRPPQEDNNAHNDAGACDRWELARLWAIGTATQHSHPTVSTLSHSAL